MGAATAESLRIWFLSNLFGFLAVAYLSSLLAQSLRRKGAELEEKSEELLDLQDFTEDIIHSMRGGLLTTDLGGPRGAAEPDRRRNSGASFREYSRAECCRRSIAEFWLPGPDRAGERFRGARRSTFAPRTGSSAISGISVSPLRSRDTQRSGYVFNFQDLTELRRLEQEVATKERMAALGRLSAAIAHEIRQPLTAMAGAVKELARLVPLEEDEKHLVNIVSRESERLNQIITDFLNYSREKTYEFEDADVRSLLDETLTLLEKKPEFGSNFRIVRSFNGEAAARASGCQQDQAGVLESVRQRGAGHARRRHADGAHREESRSGCASRFRIPAWDWTRSSAPRFLSRCNRSLKAARGWGFPSCTRLCRRIAGASA